MGGHHAGLGLWGVDPCWLLCPLLEFLRVSVALSLCPLPHVLLRRQNCQSTSTLLGVLGGRK